MVDAIVEGVPASRVILFGSRARGDARAGSDYDLVVELTFERSAYWETYRRVCATLASAKDGVSVDVLIWQPGEIEAKRDDPGYMDWAIAREGVVIHPAGAGSEALRPRSRGQVREHRPYQSINAWMERIEQDLRIVEMSLSAGESVAWGAAGFHALEAAEKYLKILLVQHGIRPPRVHEIDALIALVRNAGYDFPPFADEAGLLNPYAVTVRYPEQAPIPNEAEGRAAVRAAQQIIDAAKALLSA
jgi:HEPN domain-containing protein/predicted nucleotidyltransferase